MADGSISSSPQKSVASAWIHWIVPSIADLIFVVLVALFCFTVLSIKLLNDAGIGWHIRAGQQILATHHVPRVDSYSSIMSGKPWIAWEWLYDVIVGALDSALGLNGVVWFTAAVIATVFAAMFQWMVARRTNLLVALTLTLLAIAASMIHILARPHVVSWLFLLIWFCVLDRSERDTLAGKPGLSGSQLWGLPASMLLWVNLHGGFLLGLVLCVIFWISAAWSLRTSSRTFEDNLVRLALGRRVRNLALVTVASAAATFVNPYGWHLHRHIVAYLGNAFLIDHIEEFQSPNFHLVAQKCFLALLLLALIALALRKRTLRASELLLVLFAVYVGLNASRNIPIASILLVLVIGPRWPLLVFTKFSENMATVDARFRGHLWSIATLIFVFAVAVNGGRFGGTILFNAHFGPQRMPIAAIDDLEQNGISQPVLAPDYWGGYLIYRLYPHNKVVLDDRHDLYGEKILASYLKTFRAQPGWDKFLTAYNVRCVMMPRNAALTAALSQSPGWKTVYSDNVAITFVAIDSQQFTNLPGRK